MPSMNFPSFITLVISRSCWSNLFSWSVVTFWVLLENRRHRYYKLVPGFEPSCSVCPSSTVCRSPAAVRSLFNMCMCSALQPAVKVYPESLQTSTGEGRQVQPMGERGDSGTPVTLQKTLQKLRASNSVARMRGPCLIWGIVRKGNSEPKLHLKQLVVLIKTCLPDLSLLKTLMIPNYHHEGY